MKIDIDGQNVGGEIVFSNSGWANYVAVKVPNVNLTAGNHVMRVSILEGGFDIDRFEIVSKPGQAPYNGTAAAIPGIIEAENYDEGGEGIAYHDNDPGNTGNVYRLDEGDKGRYCRTSPAWTDMLPRFARWYQ